jgi:hypothetical protein
MIIAGKFSFKDGLKAVQSRYSALLDEIIQIVEEVDCSKCRTKKSKEKTMPGRLLYNPRALNTAFKEEFGKRGWESKKVRCDYPTEFYENNYEPKPLKAGAFREMVQCVRQNDHLSQSWFR